MLCSTGICSLTRYYLYQFFILNAAESIIPPCRFPLIRVRFKPPRAPISFFSLALTQTGFLPAPSSSSLRCPSDRVTTFPCCTGCAIKWAPGPEWQQGLWEVPHRVMQEAHIKPLMKSLVWLSHYL